jgi:hypothetical protein
MTTAVWKFPLAVEDYQEVVVPYGAIPLCVQAQGDTPCLWAWVDTSNWAAGQKATLVLRTHGTGHPIEDHPGDYLGSYQLLGGSFVGHVFWRRK